MKACSNVFMRDGVHAYSVKIRLLCIHLWLARDKREIVFWDLIGLCVAHLAVVIAIADGGKRWLACVGDLDLAAKTATSRHVNQSGGIECK